MKQPLSRFKFWGKFHIGISFLILTILICFAYGIVTQFNLRFDLTSNRIFSLGSVTGKVLQEIENEPVRVIAFFRSNSREREVFRELMKSYESKLKKLQVIIYDPDQTPSMTQKYRVDEYGVVLIEVMDRTERLKGVSEERMTNAFLRVIRGEKKKVYFVKGHGESLMTSKTKRGALALAQKLEDENYAVDDLVLDDRGVPEDADVVLVLGPKADFSELEMDSLERYLMEGGNLLILIDPVNPDSLIRFETWVRRKGVDLGENIIVDKLGKALGADLLVPVVTQYADHPVTRDFTLASLLPVTRSVTPSKAIPPGVSVIPLAFTSGTSWAESNVLELEKGEAFLDISEDLKGPVSIACVVEGQVGGVDKVTTKGGETPKIDVMLNNLDLLTSSEKSNEDDNVTAFPELDLKLQRHQKTKYKLIVFGDSDFVINNNINVSGNRDLILNSIAWLTDELSLVRIQDKQRPNTPLVLKSGDQQILFWTPTVYLPCSILLLGTIFRWIRYKKTIKK